MNYKKARKVSNIFTLIGGGILFITLVFLKLDTLAVILLTFGFLVIAIGMMTANSHYRCPECNSMLPGMKWSIPGVCPSCGHKLKG